MKRLTRTWKAPEIQNPPPSGPGKCPRLDLPMQSPAGCQRSRPCSHHPGRAGSPVKSTWVPQHTCWAPSPGMSFRPHSLEGWRDDDSTGGSHSQVRTDPLLLALILGRAGSTGPLRFSILLFSFMLLDFQCLFIINSYLLSLRASLFSPEVITYKQTNVPPFQKCPVPPCL